MSYNIYLSSNTITPFVVINDNTIDSTSTSVEFIGRSKIGYGQAQDQSILWMLENFANGTAPNNPLIGQLWYNKTNNNLYVYTTASTWELVGSPVYSSVGPSLPGSGNLWFDSVNNVLNAWNGTTWVTIGPSEQIAPISVYEQDYSTNITTDATSTELWKNGITGNRLVIPSNTTWLFEIQVSARRTDSGQEFGGWKIKGAINNTSGNVALAAPASLETYGATSAWTVAATADNINSSLDIFVTGQAGKIVSWTAITSLVKAQ